MPLRLRLALLFALATAVAITLAGAAFVLQLRVSVEASLDPGLRAQAAAVADELEADDEPGPLPTGAAVQVTAPDGTLIRTSPEAGSSAVLTPAQLEQARAGELSFTTELRGDRSRVLAVAIPAGSGRVLTVVTGTDVADAAVERAQLALLLGGPPAVLLAGAGAWLLAGAALRPVERMRKQAAEISDRDVDRRLAVPATRDEIAALGRRRWHVSAGSSRTPDTSSGHRWRSCARSSSWRHGRGAPARTSSRRSPWPARRPTA
jgi:hypothetical protein